MRYTLHDFDAALARIAQALAARLAPPGWLEPRYNVSLSQVAPVVAAREDGPVVRGMVWGYLPLRERGSPNRRMHANSRAETAAKMPAFRESVQRRRCLVPANGFYEWRAEGGGKQPYLFTLRGGEPFALAGLWEETDGSFPETYCVVTTAPNSLVQPIHHRMPMILSGEDMKSWIGSEPIAEDAFARLSRPFDPDRMSVRPVNRHVNNSRNEGPKCLAPPDPEEPELPFDRQY